MNKPLHHTVPQHITCSIQGSLQNVVFSKGSIFHVESGNLSIKWLTRSISFLLPLTV